VLVVAQQIALELRIAQARGRDELARGEPALFEIVEQLATASAIARNFAAIVGAAASAGALLQSCQGGLREFHGLSCRCPSWRVQRLEKHCAVDRSTMQVLEAKILSRSKVE